jgi:hypothetical protein
MSLAPNLEMGETMTRSKLTEDHVAYVLIVTVEKELQTSNGCLASHFAIENMELPCSFQGDAHTTDLLESSNQLNLFGI